MTRRRIDAQRVYTAHPVSNDVRRKAERIRNKGNITYPKKRVEEIEFSEKILFEKWKEEHGK